jgi:hypothetical protein
MKYRRGHDFHSTDFAIRYAAGRASTTPPP